MRFWRELVGFGLVTGSVLSAAPVVPGLHSDHPLDEAGQGKILVDELACAACHDGISKEGMKRGPDLREVGSRVSAGYLRKYLANPHGVHPGSTMPDVLAGLSEEEKAKVSESISLYLASLKAEKEEKAVEGDARRGHEIYHEVGCVSCHAPRNGDDKVAKGMVSLKHLPGKYEAGALARFLRDPLKVRPSGRMPDLNLTSGEAAHLEAYLAAAEVTKLGIPTADQVKEGKKNFEKFNCVACHDMGEGKAGQGPKLGAMDFDKGCLSGDGISYQLDEGQKKAIKVALEKPVKLSDDERVQVKLTQLNCIACHKRDDFGGVSEENLAYFHSSEEGLGDSGRIPPPLTKAGGKLKGEWMNKVLYDGLSIRPYMKVRMPQFGRKALAGLPELMAKVDVVPEVEMVEPGREDRPMVRNGGHLLLGVDGLNCISCHNYNGKEGPGMKGLDLITSYQRLQPGWYYEFMKDPAGHRPGIIMPNYWPGGKAVQPDIMGGDTHEQLRALWYQFSLGRSARDPKGLRSEPNELVVGDEVRVYRGRSRVAGYRGVAVGYPGGMNYAFNAENGALSAIWKGKYVTANWRSQGAGDFNPVERAIQLSQDVAFLGEGDFKKLKGEWPLRPVMTKEQPVNPDPLYPKNYGYAFKGYSFDERGNPTFEYRCGEVKISDRSVVVEGVLRRTFELTAEKDGVVYFRALRGKVIEKADALFEVPGLQVGFPAGRALVKKVGEGEREVLVEMKVSKGKTTYTIDYVLVR